MIKQPMGRRILALAIAMFAVALAVAATTNHALLRLAFGANIVLAVIIASVLLLSAGLIWLSTFDHRRSSALVRLDVFVPVLRKLKTHQNASQTLVGRWLRAVLPASFLSNHTTKQRGLLRKGLRKLGVSWLASPLRRIVQATCLLLFLWLFFYVCWPYHARPSSEAWSSPGWSLLGIDQTSGELTLESAQANPWAESSLGVGDQVFLILASPNGVVAGQASGSLGRFTLSKIESSSAALTAAENMSTEALDALITQGNVFELHERDADPWPAHYAESLAAKEFVPAELFLIIDPLVSLSTAIASRSWVWSLVSAAAILIVCLLIPRGFCGYLCPLGSTIDLFDWAIAGRTKRFRVADDGWWVHIKYYLLGGTLVAAVCGVLVSGFVSAIPVLTRGMLFFVEPFQSSAARGWHLVPAFGLGQWISLLLFFAVLGLGFFRPRFWCKYVCPSGAVFSLGNLFRVTERKVESSCINCNKCIEICPFDAIKPDFTTRTTDCTMCQSCGGVCPTHAIKFVERWNIVELKIENDPPTKETLLGRRGFLSLAGGSTAAVIGGIGIAGATKAFGADLDNPNSPRPVRPPGSVPEQKFLEMCIRCGECFKACPNNVLQPEGFLQGLEGLWTPLVNADWAGCESSCNACGQVCPTGAIRALPLEEKRVARMGLAIVNESTCLPFAQREACDLCVQECNAAGYHAIEYTEVGTSVDSTGQPIEGTGYLAPIVLAELCVGCGLCQTRCYAINVKEKRLLSGSAIIIEAGEGKEDRMMDGSYIELRAARPRQNASTNSAYYVPDDKGPAGAQPISGATEDEDPFGLEKSSDAQGAPPSDEDPFGIR